MWSVERERGIFWMQLAAGVFLYYPGNRFAGSGIGQTAVFSESCNWGVPASCRGLCNSLILQFVLRGGGMEFFSWHIFWWDAGWRKDQMFYEWSGVLHSLPAYPVWYSVMGTGYFSEKVKGILIFLSCGEEFLCRIVSDLDWNAEKTQCFSKKVRKKL